MIAARKRLVDMPSAPVPAAGWGERWLASASGAGRAGVGASGNAAAVAAPEYRTQGVVVRKAIRRFTIDDFEIAATKDDPRWVVKSEKTGKRAAHKVGGLRLLKPH